MPSKRRYGQLGRLFRISKFVGLFPYDGRYTLSWTGLLYSLSILAAVSASLYNEILIFTSIAIAWYGIMLFYLLEYSAMLVLCYALIIKSVFNGKDVGKIFESFERVDLSLGTSLTEDNIRIYPIVINVFILFPICLDFRRNLIYTSLTDSLPNIFFITATFSLSVTVETQFDLLLRSISRRLEHCRTALRRIPHSSNDIDRVIDTYGVLVDQVSRINDMYSPQMLLIISWIFVEIVHVEYSAISERADGSGLEVRRALLFLWVFSRFAQLTNIINICSSTSQKAKEFNDTLYQLAIDHTGVLAANKKIWLHLAAHKKIKLTACGFFPLDYTLLHSMVKAITTYIIILIQLRGEDDNGIDKAFSTATTMHLSAQNQNFSC